MRRVARAIGSAGLKRAFSLPALASRETPLSNNTGVGERGRHDTTTSEELSRLYTRRYHRGDVHQHRAAPRPPLDSAFLAPCHRRSVKISEPALVAHSRWTTAGAPAASCPQHICFGSRAPVSSRRRGRSHVAGRAGFASVRVRPRRALGGSGGVLLVIDWTGLRAICCNMSETRCGCRRGLGCQMALDAPACYPRRSPLCD